MATYDGTSTVAGVAPSGNIYSLVVPSKSSSYDGDMVTMQYKTLTINSGVTLGTDQACRGMLIYVQGNCTIAGTLSMKQRGPLADPNSGTGGSDNSAVNAAGLQLGMRTASGTSTLSAATFAGSGTPAVTLVANQPAISGNGTIFTCVKPATTNNGATAIHTAPGHNGGGSVGTAGLTATNSSGTGGAGGKYVSNLSVYGGSGVVGSGGCGTPWGGGPGGGGINGGTSGTNTLAFGVDHGGAGGYGRSAHTARCSAGSGNPKGGSTTASGYPSGSAIVGSGEDGVGGLIYLIVGGNLTITGTISVVGSKADNVNSTSAGWASGGGGSGGGNIRIAYKGTLSDSGTKTVAGGAAGIANPGSYANPYTRDGGPGGAGVLVLAQVL